MFKRYFILAYALVAYGVASANLFYLLGFIADLGVPKGINDGEESPFWVAVSVDIGLLWLFGFHHSVTARKSFKKWWTKFIPPSIERATYLMMTAMMTGLLVVFWKPIPITIWQVENPVIINSVLALYFLIWGVMALATFQFGHFSFFGIQQAWDRFRNQPETQVSFSTKWLYGMIRHPISLCWMLTPWITPHLTVGNIVFAVGIMTYIFVCTPFEENDLISDIGDAYRQYRKRVPSYIPFLKK